MLTAADLVATLVFALEGALAALAEASMSSA
jgi:hypothetical protein